MNSKIQTLDDIKDRCQVTETGCWEWQLHCNHGGYALGWVDGRTRAMHRVVAEMTLLKVAGNELVMHSCDNPKCLNPSHLSWATHKLNMADKVSKNRQYKPTGSSNVAAKLSEQDVIAIRQARANGQKASFLAEQYKMSIYSIYQILNYTTWTNVSGSV